MVMQKAMPFCLAFSCSKRSLHTVTCHEERLYNLIYLQIQLIFVCKYLMIRIMNNYEQGWEGVKEKDLKMKVYENYLKMSNYLSYTYYN